MKDYKEYPYGRTLQFFDAYYPYDVEDVHYADVMLSMRRCKTIDELIIVRERLKKKIKTIDLNYVYNDKKHKDIIEKFNKNAYGYRLEAFNENLRLDIDSCYNENVFRILKENNITEQSCGECFINLSHIWEGTEYKGLIIQEAKDRANIDVSGLLDTIIKRHKDFQEHWNQYRSFKEGMNGYNSAKKLVEDDFEYLKQFNWRLLPWEKSLYSKINREKPITQDDFLNERRKYWRQIREIEGPARKYVRFELKDPADPKIKEQRRVSTETIGIIVGCVFFLALFIGFLMLKPDDTIMNWILAILVILAILKKA